jgi:hypothetical protein
MKFRGLIPRYSWQAPLPGGDGGDCGGNDVAGDDDPTSEVVMHLVVFDVASFRLVMILFFGLPTTSATCLVAVVKIDNHFGRLNYC